VGVARRSSLVSTMTEEGRGNAAGRSLGGGILVGYSTFGVNCDAQFEGKFSATPSR